MTEYTITIDRTACTGVFACLVRDDRFVEGVDGIADLDVAAEDRDEADGTVTATLTDGRLATAEQAAAACPVDAITVEER